MTNVRSGELKRSLTLRHVVFFGLAFMAPGTAFATYGVAANQSSGMITSGYAIALFVMLFTAYSYAKLVKVFPSAGSAFTFTQKAMNPFLGFLVGWTVLLDYMLSPMISSLILGIALSAYFPAIPMFIWIILFVAVITTVNILGIKFAANFNTYNFLFQLMVTILFCIFSVIYILNGEGLGTLFSILPIYDPDVNFSALIGVMPILCFTFLGFDAVTALSEETENPKETMPKAIFLIPLIGGLICIVVTYFLLLVYPNVEAFTDPQSAYLEIIFVIGGIFLKSLFVASSILAGFASAVASGSSASRILYAMGRENILPKQFFGYISPKFHTPIYNILFVALVALTAIFFNLTTATAFINFGAFFTFIFVNLSVISYFFIRKRQHSLKETIQYLVIPAIGAIFIFGLLLTQDMYALVLGGCWLIVGSLYLIRKTKSFKQMPTNLFSDSK
ncbi:APC family permease [Alteribacillus bidgolensis]|uniref:Putrescine:proton symporter, AAT family n=1 Tax=Alteribacillus bidgolensis TaxID=930129 RepID=A0A1G8MQB8_9BACI|nr:APC family permease [Alteribacillus bidgolensis]SDI70015.1 putrescine:proton symporter, AAT family [Alteribacillus bidgolensis]